MAGWSLSGGALSYSHTDDGVHHSSVLIGGDTTLTVIYDGVEVAAGPVSSVSIDSAGNDSFFHHNMSLTGSQSWTVSLGKASTFSSFTGGVGGHLGMDVSRDDGSSAGVFVGSILAGASVDYTDTVSGDGGSDFGAFQCVGTIAGGLSMTYTDGSIDVTGNSFTGYVYAARGSGGSVVANVNGNVSGGDKLTLDAINLGSASVTAGLKHGPGATVFTVGSVTVSTY